MGHAAAASSTSTSSSSSTARHVLLLGYIAESKSATDISALEIS